MSLKAKVYVTLKSGVLDPQGKTVLRALRTLGHQAVRDVRQGKYFELNLADGLPAGGSPRDGGDHRPRGPDQHRDRGIPLRAGGAMKVGVVVFPGSNCDHDAYHAVKHVLRPAGAYLWHKDDGPAGLDAVILPAASPTATTCAPAPSPGSPRS